MALKAPVGRHRHQAEAQFLANVPSADLLPYGESIKSIPVSELCAQYASNPKPISSPSLDTGFVSLKRKREPIGAPFFMIISLV